MKGFSADCALFLSENAFLAVRRFLTRITLMAPDSFLREKFAAVEARRVLGTRGRHRSLIERANPRGISLCAARSASGGATPLRGTAATPTADLLRIQLAGAYRICFCPCDDKTSLFSAWHLRRSASPPNWPATTVLLCSKADWRAILRRIQCRLQPVALNPLEGGAFLYDCRRVLEDAGGAQRNTSTARGEAAPRASLPNWMTFTSPSCREAASGASALSSGGRALSFATSRVTVRAS